VYSSLQARQFSTWEPRRQPEGGLDRAMARGDGSVEMSVVNGPTEPAGGGARDFSTVDVDIEVDVTMCSEKLRVLIEDKSFFEPKAATQLWTSRLSYTLAAVGSAVGLGNIWRFPYLCYRNGGATFLIPYFISLFGLGIPLFALEFTLGQGTGKSALGANLALDRRVGGVGLLTFISTSGIVIYYCVILAWCTHYLVSFLGAMASPQGLPFAPGQVFATSARVRHAPPRFLLSASPHTKLGSRL
jgi:hypothetical protein